MIRQLIHNLLPVWLIVTMIIRRHSITETKEWVGLTIISLIDNSVVFCLFFFLLKIYKCHSIESNPVLHCFFLCFHSIDFSNQTPPVFIVLYRSVLILSHLAYLFFVTACNCKGRAWILKLPWNREFHNNSLYGTPKKYLGFIANMECRFCHFVFVKSGVPKFSSGGQRLRGLYTHSFHIWDYKTSFLSVPYLKDYISPDLLDTDNLVSHTFWVWFGFSS